MLCHSDDKCLKFWKIGMQSRFLFTQHFFLDRDFQTGVRISDCELYRKYGA